MNLAATRGLAPLREQLANGAVIIAKETRTTPAVTISAAVGVGSADDPPEAPGTVFFLSRTLDRGTARRTADQIADELDSRGVSLTVAVTRHALTITCTCLSEDFPEILALVGEMLRHAVFPDAEVEKRRLEILTSLRQDLDNPAVRATDALMGLLYGSWHPYGRPPKGTVESIERLDRAALVAFHAARITPDRLRLVIVGDVDPQAAVAQGACAVGEWSQRCASEGTLPPVEPPTARRRVVVPMMNKAQVDIAYGFVAVARRDPAYYAYWVMNNILGQYSLGGRLGERIRERQGMAYYVYSTLDASLIEGPLMIRAGVAPRHVEPAVRAIDEEVARMAREGVTDQELAESKQYLIGSIPRMLETNAGIANFLQTVEQFELGLDYDARLPDLIGGVTREAVCAAAERTLDPDRAALALAGPYQENGPDT
jgi:zinc protease